jgi:N-methylhydantoinase A
MRYLGQGYEVEVPLPEGNPADVFAQLSSRFARAYAAIFGMSFADREVEIVAWKVEVQGAAPGGGATYRLRTPARSGPALRGHRPAYFPELGGKVSCAVYDRYRLAAGAMISGPALVEEAESTCVIAPGDRATIDATGHLVIDISVSPTAAPAAAETERA